MPTEHPSGEGRSVVALSALAALAAGGLASIQSRANGQLAHSLGAPVLASVWSFGSGWVVLVLLLLARPGSRRALAGLARAVRERRVPVWTTVGGLLGGFFVAVQTFAVPTLGVALFTIALVGGQTTNSLVVDRLGLGPAGAVRVTRGRVVAALLTFVGVAVAATARSGGSTGALAVGPLLLAILAGAGIAVQQALNGRVNAIGGDVVATSFTNFSWGLGLLAGWVALLGIRGTLHGPATVHVPWWSLVGGLVGVVYVAVGAVVVHHLGVLVAALITLTGQLLSAVAMDLLDPVARAHVGPQLLLGVGLTLVAAVGAGVAAQRARRVAR